MKPKKYVGPIFRKSYQDVCDVPNAKFKYIMEKCSEPTDCCIQQECVKVLANCLKTSVDNEDKNIAIKLLAYMYLSCTAKHPIKKTITRILVQCDCNDRLSQEFSNFLKHTLNIHMKNQNRGTEDVDHFINSLYTSFDVKAVVTAILENVHELFNYCLAFLNKLVECLWERSKETLSSQLLHTYLYNTTKFFLCISQHYNTKNIVLDYKIILINRLYEIITHVNVAYEVKCNSSHIMVILLSTLPDHFFDDSFFKEHLYLQILQETECLNLLEKLGINDVGDAAMKEIFYLCLYIGISIVAPSDVLYRYPIGDQSALSFMLQNLVNSASSYGMKSNISRMMGISKAIASLSSHLYHLDGEELSCIYRKSLDYINIYIDDIPEVVKGNTQTLFKSLIKITLKAKEEGRLTYQNMLFKWLNNLIGCSNFYAIVLVLCSALGCSIVLQEYSNLPMMMLNDVIHLSKSLNVLSNYERLMKIHRREVQFISDWLNCWVEPIVVHLTNSDEPQKLFQELFVAAFKIDSDAIAILIGKQHLNTDSEIMALLGCVHHSRKGGKVLNLSSYCSNLNSCWRNYLDYKTLTILKTHLNEEIRLLVLAIIVDSHSSTEVLTEWELTFLIDYYYYNVSSPSSSFRQKLISYAKKMLMRIKDVTNTLQHRILVVKSVKSDDLREKLLEKLNVDVTPTITAFKNFWNSLFEKVLLPGIYLDSNYSRKVTCLEILCFSCTVIPKPSIQELFKKCDIENLKYILEYDTYEQNKEVALKLLTEFSSSLFAPEEDALSMYVDECLNLTLNIKPSRTIAAAYMISLCLQIPGICGVVLQKIKTRDVAILKSVESSNDKLILSDAKYLMVTLLCIELRDCLLKAQQNIIEAVTKKPTHGLIFCIRYILNNIRLKSSLSNWKILINKLILLCLEVSLVANTIVCNESPEGYIPGDSVIDIDETAKSQVVTVYGWRATKEISLLFGELAQLCLTNDCESLVTEEQLRSLGQYFFDLLINTKHRGAFEQASVGFSNLCSILWRLDGTAVCTLPVQWLDSITAMLCGESSDGIKSCETRRSAGIPFMAQAILSTEPTTENAKHFDIFMKVLLDVSSNTLLPSEQRILGLNILRALFRHNQLGELVMPFCSSGLKIAIRGFSSNIWGVCNSSTLLFSALVMRIFGVQRLRDMEVISIKNKMQGHIFFVRYPDLFTFLIEELKMASQVAYHPSLYPILIILNRLYSNKETLDRIKLDAFLPYVEVCLNNTSYQIRNLAAQANASLIESNKLSKNVADTIKNLSEINISDNYCHGLLQKLHYLLCSPHNSMSDFNITKFVEDTSWILLLCGQDLQWISGMYYLESVMHLLIRFDPHFLNERVFNTLIQILLWQEKQEWRNNVISKYNELVFNVKLAYILHLRNVSNSGLTEDTCKAMINADLTKYIHLQHLVLTYLNYIKFTEPAYKSYGLFLVNLEDSEYLDVCNEFLNPMSQDKKSFLYEVLLNALWNSIEDNISNINCAVDMLLLHKLTNVQKDMISSLLSYRTRRYIKNSDEEFYCLVLVYFSNNINQGSKIDTKILSNLIYVLCKCSLPTADYSLRLILSKFLVHNRGLFCSKTTLQGSDLYQMWEIIFIVLEDDDEDVRNTICHLSQRKMEVEDSQSSLLCQMRVDIPEYTRDLLLDQMIETLSKEDSIRMLISLTLRSRAMTNGNLSEVFEEGTLNTYIEYWPGAKAAIRKLENFLLKCTNNACSNQFVWIAGLLHSIISHSDLPLVSTVVKTTLCTILETVQLQKKVDNCNVEKIYLNNIKDPLDFDKSELLRLKMLLNQTLKIRILE